jgi:hypothetical protein
LEAIKPPESVEIGDPKVNIPEETEKPPVGFPADLCPTVKYLQEDRQIFFQVAGRRKGDFVVIEKVKLW